VNSDDIKLDDGFYHAQDGEQERDAGNGWQEDHILVPIGQLQSITIFHPRFWNLSIQNKPDLTQTHSSNYIHMNTKGILLINKSI
jgi:hypothetical protein